MTTVDHLVFAAPELTKGVAVITRQLGVSPAPGGRHPQWGTQNALLSLGSDTYFEVIGPDTGTPLEKLPAAFQIDQVDRPRLVTWAAKTPQLETTVERAAQRGITLGSIIDGQRKRPDGSLLSWRFTDPLVVLGDGIVPFLIDWGATENPAKSTPPGCTLLDLRAEHPQPERIRAILEILGQDLPVRQGKTPRLIATIQTPRGIIELQ